MHSHIESWKCCFQDLAALPLFVDRPVGRSQACNFQRHDLFLVDRVATQLFKLPSDSLTLT